MPFSATTTHFMKEALAFARIAFSEQEVPIGAVVVSGGKMIGTGAQPQGVPGRPDPPRGDRGHPGSRPGGGHVAPGRRDALRHSRALRHVRRRGRQRPHRPHRLRVRRPQGRLLRHPRQHPAGRPPEPPLRSGRRPPRRTNPPQLLQLFFRARRNTSPRSKVQGPKRSSRGRSDLGHWTSAAPPQRRDYWRRGWDLNPRSPFGAYRFSRPA